MAPRRPISIPDSRFTCAAKPNREADVHVYGSIGVDWWGEGVDPTAFVKAIDALDVDRLNVKINSPGGDAFGGVAMANALRRHKAHVVVTVDGLAASAASMVAMGGDELVMGRNSMLMVHDASGLCLGNAADMAETATILDKLSDSYAQAYAEKAGGSAEEWRDVMRAETWMTADEAVAAKLADRVDAAVLTEATASFDLSKLPFAHAGRADAPAPKLPTAAAPEPPAEPGAVDTPTEGADMSDLMSGLRDRLGIPADAEMDEGSMLAALDEALNERAEKAPATTASVPEGTVLMDAAQLESLRADAAAGREARAEQVANRRAGLVEAAVADGRIAPARREHWLAQLNADEEGATSVLASLEPGTIPVAPVGYVGGVDESSDDDPIYTKAWGDSGRKGA